MSSTGIAWTELLPSALDDALCRIEAWDLSRASWPRSRSSRRLYAFRSATTVRCSTNSYFSINNDTVVWRLSIWLYSDPTIASCRGGRLVGVFLPGFSEGIVATVSCWVISYEKASLSRYSWMLAKLTNGISTLEKSYDWFLSCPWIVYWLVPAD